MKFFFLLIFVCAGIAPVHAKSAFPWEEDSAEYVLLKQIQGSDTLLLVAETERRFLPSKDSPFPKYVRVFRVIETLRGNVETKVVLHYSDHYGERIFPENDCGQAHVERWKNGELFYLFLNSEKISRCAENCYFYEILGEGPIWGNPIPCGGGLWADAVARILKTFAIGVFGK
ncbi:MAG: hypothetical protein IJW39_01540 [Opitutales bacterium]|nr:hypothetical protein [Opitutales bacterium]